MADTETVPTGGVIGPDSMTLAASLSFSRMLFSSAAASTLCSILARMPS